MYARRRLLPFVTSILFLGVLIGCDGGGGEGNRTSTINGRVTSVLARGSFKKEGFMLSFIKDILGFSKSAVAQGSGVSGIEVLAFVNGQEVDSDVTDEEGTFTLSVPGGSNVLLEFRTEEFRVSVEVFAPEGATVNVTVSLTPEEAEVEEVEVAGAIRCETGVLSLSFDELSIEGDGEEDCIRAEGNCVLDIEAGSVLLSGCERCIDARGEAELVVNTAGDFLCEAREDGIRSRGTSFVRVSSAGSIVINSSPENGIRAEGDSEIILLSDADIFILGREHGIRAEGNVFVDVEAGGECTIEGGESAIRIEGNSVVNTGSCNLIGGIDVDDNDNEEED